MHLEVHIYNTTEDSRCSAPHQQNCYWSGVFDRGNYQFYITVLGGGEAIGGGAMLCDDGSLRTVPTVGCSVSNFNAATIFTLAAITGVPAAQVPAGSLQKGQAALYSQPDCSGTATVVMPGDHWFEASAASVRMPHDTRITLYPGGVVLNGGLKGLKCINMGAGFVAESITVEYTPDILISTTKCRYCDLYGLSLQNMTLDGFDLSYAYLVNTHFNSSSMKGINLSHAVLAGAQLDEANLQGSNMCNALLQGNDESPLPPASTGLI